MNLSEYISNTRRGFNRTLGGSVSHLHFKNGHAEEEAWNFIEQSLQGLAEMMAEEVNLEEFELMSDRFYSLYKKGRKEEKAPISYIDYFKARHFLFKEVNKAKDALSKFLGK